MTHISGHDHPPDQECRFPCPATEVGPDGKIRLKNAAGLQKERQTREETDVSDKPSKLMTVVTYAVPASGVTPSDLGEILDDLADGVLGRPDTRVTTISIESGRLRIQLQEQDT